MPRAFTYEQPASRVLFGVASLERLPEELTHLGLRKALILCTPGRAVHAERISERLGARSVGVYAGAIMHVPVETARAARRIAAERNADGCVAIGGGSTIGLAKAIALETGLPIVAVPTTYAGSEMTPIYGLTEDGIKKTGRNARVLPRTVIYDPVLTLDLPPTVAGPSGMNALAHCIESLYAPDGNPFTSLLAAEGIRALSRSLPVVVQATEDLDARADAQYGAWLAGMCLNATSMGLHHKLCHALGGSFNLPHAEVHAVILPHATAFNREAAPDAMRIAADALGATDPARALFDLGARLGVPLSLREIGMPADGLDRAARLATASPYANPRSVDQASVRELLERAFNGMPPIGR
jgi:alcohol dehydrogenase class IV